MSKKVVASRKDKYIVFVHVEIMHLTLLQLEPDQPLPEPHLLVAGHRRHKSLHSRELPHPIFIIFTSIFLVYLKKISYVVLQFPPADTYNSMANVEEVLKSATNFKGKR